MGEHVLCARHAVRRKLDHKGRFLAGEHRLFEQQAGEDAERHAKKIQAEDHDPPVPREKRARKQAVDRQLCGAAHERQKEHRHAAVTFVIHRARAHRGRYGAAKAHQKRDEALPGKAEAAHGLIHDKCDAAHVAAVLQNGKAEEQQRDLRQEREHAAHALDDAIAHKAREPCRCGSECRAHKRRKTIVDQHTYAVGKERAQSGKRQREDHGHDEDEHRDRPDFMRQDRVDLCAALDRALLLAARKRSCRYALDVAVAAIRHGALVIAHRVCRRVVPHDRVHLLRRFRRQAQRIAHPVVPFQELDLCPVQREVRRLCIRFHQFADAVVLHVGVIVIYIVRLDVEAFMELRMRRIDELLRAADQLVNPLPGARTDWHHGDAKLQRQALAVDLVAVLFHLVHHVEGDDHRPLQLEQLHGQVQVALKVRTIHDVDDGIRLFVDDVIPRYDLFHRVGGKRIDARQIHERHLMPLRAERSAVCACGLDLPFFFLDRYAGPVADIFLPARHGVEERCFPAVRVAGKRKAHRFAVVKRFLGTECAALQLAAGAVFQHKARQHRRARMAFLVRIARVLLLLKQRMCPRFMLFPRALHAVVECLVLRLFHKKNRCRIRLAQRHGIAAQRDLDRVPHRRGFYDPDLRARRDAHVHDMPPHALIRRVHGINMPAFADGKITQRPSLFLFHIHASPHSGTPERTWIYAIS